MDHIWQHDLLEPHGSSRWPYLLCHLAVLLLICLQLGCRSTSPKPSTKFNNRIPKTSLNPVQESEPSATEIQQPEFAKVGYLQDESGDTPIPDQATGYDIAPMELRSKVSNAVGTKLSLQQVLQSVADCYPEIEAAFGEAETADGKLLAAWGEFDQVFSAHSISQPLGFYQTYRNGVGLEQPLYGGGEVYGTYRIGDGNFEPWFGERETNEGGELKAGFSLPLAKDRLIDKRRAGIFASEFQRDQVQANIESRLLIFQRMATQAYWDWVAAGQAIQVQVRLLELAEARVNQIEERIKDEDLEKRARIDNDRFIAKRKNDLIKARRLLEKTTIKLSIFWRDANCQPVLADPAQLPSNFPQSIEILARQLLGDIQMALNVRPELVELLALRKETSVDLQYATNLTLPKVDVKGFAGQDLGGQTSSTGDKTPFELQLGVLAEVPLQRREGLGKIQAARGKLIQIDAKTQLVSDKIRAEVQDAASAVNAAHEQILQSTENLRLTREALELGREAFDEGEIGLIELNIYETSVADAELQLLDANFKHFFYRAVYQTAISGRFEMP